MILNENKLGIKIYKNKHFYELNNNCIYHTINPNFEIHYFIRMVNIGVFAYVVSGFKIRKKYLKKHDR